MEEYKGFGPSVDRCSVLVRVWYVVGLVILFVAVISYIDGASGFMPSAVVHNPWPVFLNALPGLCLSCLLLVLTRRALFSFWITLSLYALLDRVNAIKVSNLQTPLLPQDASFLKAMNLSSVHLFGEYAGSLVWVGLGLLAWLVVTVVVLWLEAPVIRRRWRSRLIPLLVLVVVFIAIEVGGGWRWLYGKTHVAYEPWDPLHTSKMSGLVNTLFAFGLAKNATNYVPKASTARVEALFDRYGSLLPKASGTNGPVNAKHPNIIILQSESFFDPTVLNGFNKRTWLPYLHYWQTRGADGWMHVPTFGGGTIRTEFEVLTGISLRATPHVNYPYLQLPSMKLPGLVSVLNRDGYDTISIHPNGAGFWNRGQTFRELGFKRSIWIGDFYEPVVKDGPYASDKSFTDEIIHELKQSSHGKPKFIFAISIESHGPYKYQPDINKTERNAITVPHNLSGKDALHLKSYLYHLHHVDVQLNRLAKVVMASKRPTILLFYGDHLPPLPATYKALGFKNGGKMLTEPVPWLLLDNRKSPRLTSRAMAAWMMPGILLRLAHVESDGFFRLTSMLPSRLARLTHSPWVKAARPEPSDEKLVQELRDADLLRIKGKFKALYARYVRNHGAQQEGSPVAAVASALGQYVNSDYRVGGIDTSFASGSPLFARIDLAGDGQGITVSAQVHSIHEGKVLRQAQSRVDVFGTNTVNLDMRGDTPLAPGRYKLDVYLGQTLQQSLVFSIRAPANDSESASH